MSIYDDLRSEFSAWRDAYFDDQRRYWGFAQTFIARYIEYIGAPKEYRNGFDRDDELTPYVFPCSVTLNEEEHTFEARRESTVIRSLSEGSDKRWYFAVGTTLEVAPTTYPKQWWPQLCSFYLDGDSCHLRVTSNSEGEFALNLNDVTSFHPAFDYMVALHKRELRKRRVDLVAPSRHYGFVPPSPRPTQTPPVVNPYVPYEDD